MERRFRGDRPEQYSPVEPKIRHVWVAPPNGIGAETPGLVIAWRRERGSSLTSGWSAQVAIVSGGDNLLVSWYPSESLRPARDVSPQPQETEEEGRRRRDPRGMRSWG